jgi:hypothetical protein
MAVATGSLSLGSPPLECRRSRITRRAGSSPERWTVGHRFALIRLQCPPRAAMARTPFPRCARRGADCRPGVLALPPLAAMIALGR